MVCHGSWNEKLETLDGRFVTRQQGTSEWTLETVASSQPPSTGDPAIYPSTMTLSTSTACQAYPVDQLSIVAPPVAGVPQTSLWTENDKVPHTIIELPSPSSPFKYETPFNLGKEKEKSYGKEVEELMEQYKEVQKEIGELCWTFFLLLMLLIVSITFTYLTYNMCLVSSGKRFYGAFTLEVVWIGWVLFLSQRLREIIKEDSENRVRRQCLRKKLRSDIERQYVSEV